MQTSQQDLLALKTALEKPGVGKKRHDLAKKSRDRDDVPLEWIREWLNTKWHVIGCKYLWLAAMNACIGRNDIPLDLIDQGLRKTDPSTFNAAITVCRGCKISFEVILQWYDLGNTVFRMAAVNACVDNPDVQEWFIEQATDDPDDRIRQLAKSILSEKNGTD